MSVELLDTPRFHGYRVRRHINGKTYQEYFSLKEDGKRIRGSKRSAIKKQADARAATPHSAGSRSSPLQLSD
jgi:hypothetical protein